MAQTRFLVAVHEDFFHAVKRRIEPDGATHVRRSKAAVEDR
jgi:hypothetical protein